MDKLSYKTDGKFRAQGGAASLESVTLEDGTEAVIRRLHFARLLNFRNRRQFIRGLRIRAALSGSARIVEQYEWSAGLWPYELIEYVPGDNLNTVICRKDDFLKQNRLEILRQAAEALAWVHSNGFMHLDVKPENYLLHREPGGTFQVKLTDFDLARLSTDNSCHRQNGTPEYMAPEQFNQHCSYQASDVFAFGVLAFRMLTGRAPFNGNNAVEMWRNQANLKLVARSVRDFWPEVPGGLEVVIAKALEKDWHLRIPDMDTFLREWGVNANANANKNKSLYSAVAERLARQNQDAGETTKLVRP